MRILAACEMSGAVRNAFRAEGHDAYSCDLLPSLDNSLYHIKGDVLDVITQVQWDMMIAFPPCTYLCSSGLHWNRKRPERTWFTDEAYSFFMRLATADIKYIAIENPKGCVSTRWRKPDQIIQPYQFGHPESKTTCLWLKNLPKLIPTNILPLPECGYWDNQTPSKQNKLGETKERAMKRSLTYPGIAEAMAKQWGSFLG